MPSGKRKRPKIFGEAQTVAQLKHPGIVEVHGLGRTPGGGYFIAMELVEGPDLARVASQGPIAIQDAIGWVRQACDAIEHAHERGIVHCDLKPANLLLDSEGRIRVTDFGLARCRRDELSAEDRIEGTAPFMAPEQVSSVWGKIGAHTDVYGLGAVLYTLLTGHLLWHGTRLADVLAQVVSAATVSDPRARRPEVPSLVSEICLRCLAKRPAERFNTVRQLGAALALLPSGLL
jgi:serine/threonine protein kinase